MYAWIGLGLIPTLPMSLDWLIVADSRERLGISVLTTAVSAVLTGGQLRIALALIRNGPTGFQAYFHYARFAPGFFVLTLPVLLPSAVALVLLDPKLLNKPLFTGFIPATVAALFFTFRLSIASYALADSPESLWRAVRHSWRRTGARVGKFLGLFLVSGIPNAVAGALAVIPGAVALGLASPQVRILFNIATLPLITLCWTYAYDAALYAEETQDD